MRITLIVLFTIIYHTGIAKPNEIVITMQSIAGDKFQLTGQFSLWSTPSAKLTCDKYGKTAYRSVITTPDIFRISSGSSSDLSVYLEPGNQVTLIKDENRKIEFSGEAPVVERNRLYAAIELERKQWSVYEFSIRRKSKSIEKLKFEHVLARIEKLIDDFKEKGVGVTEPFLRFLYIDHKYYQMKQEVPMPNYLVKTYFDFPESDLRRIQQTVEDSRTDEAIMSLYYRQIARAYIDYLRIQDPEKRMGPGKEYIENEKRITTYFPGKEVRYMLQALNLNNIGYRHAGNPAYLMAVKELPEHWQPALLGNFKTKPNGKGGRKITNPVEFPDFSGLDENGKNISLKDLRGKWVFIDVWATWCGPCNFETPYVKQLEQSLVKENIVFLSLSVDKKEDTEKWKKYIEEKNMAGVHMLCSESGQVYTQLGINGIPHFALINPDGKLVFNQFPQPSSGVAHHLLKDLVQSGQQK